ncbi:hypothetical protein C8Q80DRAFT_1172159 [Daedaleopsis nitida]|nr:hypothetical protein C8Q80DRAFT_1172159 [Daedaleopsis nitida]
MPKKGANASRSSHPAVGIPPHMKSHLPRTSSSAPRKPVVTFQKSERDEDIMDVDDEEGGDEDDAEDESMVEMLTILQELQKRKATKSSARSAVFQKDKAALFAAARHRAEKAVRNGTASIDKARATVADLKAKEVSQEATLRKLKVLWEGHEECVQGLLGHLTGVVEDLSHRRASRIDESSASLEAQSIARGKSRKRLCTMAKLRMAENMENQKVR